MSNTEIWDKLKRVPPEHLKPFERAGGFKGTAIKPMWTIHRMTEVFGPVGAQWGIDEPKFQIIPAGEEILVYCTVSVWVERKGGPDVQPGRFFGVGGDKVIKYIKANERYNRPERWENDDEAFKKAYTDALTNALKMLGAGADVHMGLWNGSKYIDDTSSDDESSAPVMVAASGTPGASKTASRPSFEKMVKDIRNAASINGLKAWYKENITEIDALPPDFLDDLRVEYNDRVIELKAQVAS